MSQQQFQIINLPQQQEKLRNIRANVYLIRHGYSIANRSTFEDEEKWFKSKLGLIEKTYEPDPSLTRTGMEQSKNASKKIQSPDYIFTSVLCRAQQTALFMFPTEQKVIVAPYLKEKNNWVDGALINSDNKPFQDIFTQYEKRHNILSEKDLGRLEYSKRVLKNKCEYNKESRDDSGSIKDFLEKFLFDFIKKNHANDDKRVINIAIVCHGGLIKEFLGIKEHVNNNAIYKVAFKSVLDMQNITIDQQHQPPSFRPELVFSGYREFKISCDPSLVQTGRQFVRLKYPLQQILSKRGSYTFHDLQKIFANQALKQSQQRPFGAPEQRLKSAITQLKKQQTKSETIKKFKQTYPQIVEQSDQNIKKFFRENPRQLNSIVLQPIDQFEKLVKLIQETHKLGTRTKTLQFINSRIPQGSQEPEIFRIFNTLPGEQT